MEEQMAVLRLSLLIQFGFYSFLAKTPRPAVDASCRDELAASSRLQKVRNVISNVHKTIWAHYFNIIIFF